MLRRTRQEVLPELPEKRYQDVLISSVEVPTLDTALETLRKLGIDLETLEEDVNLLDLLPKPAFETLSVARAALALGKTKAAFDLIEQYEAQDVPFVVFGHHVTPLRSIAERPGWGLIIGEVPATDRAETVRRFQAGELRGIAVGYAAGGVAITLTRAAHMLHLEMPWTPAELEQAENRICRMGQRIVGRKRRLVAGTLNA
jgi:SWI/SNF-related matrix-associated actin-dependent regulator 1 of chromatin subfamily A